MIRSGHSSALGGGKCHSLVFGVPGQQQSAATGVVNNRSDGLPRLSALELLRWFRHLNPHSPDKAAILTALVTNPG
jgi:hypothetical protein